MIIRRKLKNGEQSVCEQVYERIRAVLHYPLCYCPGSDFDVLTPEIVMAFLSGMAIMQTNQEWV